MHLEEFYRKDSFISKLNPLFKFLIFLFYSIILVSTSEQKIVISFFLFSFILIILFKINLKKILKRLFVINLFIFSIVIIFVLSYGRKGLEDGIFIFLKANSIFIYTIIFVGTSSIFEIAKVFEKFFVPKKLIQILIFSYRFITVLHEEYLKIMEAAKLRGFSQKTNLKTYRTYSWVLGMILLKTYEKSKKLYEGLICRGFNGSFPFLWRFNYRMVDFIVLFLMIFFGILVKRINL